MKMETFKTSTTLKEGVVCEVESRGHKITLDEPAGLGGTDTGMNPMELLLGALGGCQAITAEIFAKQLGMKLDEFRVDIEGDFDFDTFTPQAIEAQKGYKEIRCVFHVKCDASEEKIEEFIEMIENSCPVGQSLLNNVKIAEAKIIVE
jgi:uncharacterized OsmC-like protein